MKRVLSIIVILAIAFCLPMTALAATQGDVDVDGHIGIHGDPTIDPGGDPSAPDGNYDLTFAASVHWWVTQTSHPNVINGTGSLPDATHRNKILNNSAVAINVSFVTFTGTNPDAATVDPNLTLFLTDDLNKDGMLGVDISGGYTGTAVAYTASLPANTDWEYGFSGTYTAALTSSYNPQYAMTLEFAF